MLRTTPLPTQSRLRELLSYDPETGALRWLVRPSPRVPLGSVAGTRSSDGRRQVKLEGRVFIASRLIWRMQTGEDPGELEVDHRDRDPGNDRWENLRLATHSQNSMNRGYSRRLGHLPKGVGAAGPGRWDASIMVSGRDVYLGVHASVEAAAEARRQAEVQYHGEFAVSQQ